MNAVAGANVRHALRAGTCAAHARIDALFVDGFATLSDYRIYLGGMHAFVTAIDRALQSHAGLLWPSWSHARRIASLEADLAALSLAPMDAPLPVCVIASDEQAFGALYVIEGSALGARTLLPDARRLGQLSPHGADFLCLHADGDDGRRWPRYLAMLDAHGFEGKVSSDALLQAANDAFALAGDCFARAASAQARAA